MNPITIKPDAQGKVRDIYDLGDTLLFVATDRAVDYAAVQTFSRVGNQLVIELPRAKFAPVTPATLDGLLRMSGEGDGVMPVARLPGIGFANAVHGKHTALHGKTFKTHRTTMAGSRAQAVVWRWRACACERVRHQRRADKQTVSKQCFQIHPGNCPKDC